MKKYKCYKSSFCECKEDKYPKWKCGWWRQIKETLKISMK